MEPNVADEQEEIERADEGETPKPRTDWKA